MTTSELTAAERFPFLPDVEWPMALGFWEACRENRLAFPQCKACGRFSWYPVSHCPGCSKKDFSWTTVSGRGTIYSRSILRRAFLPGFDKLIPLDLLQVRFADAPGVSFITNLSDPADSDRATIGSEIEIVFVKVNEDVTMPVARLSSSS